MTVSASPKPAVSGSIAKPADRLPLRQTPGRRTLPQLPPLPLLNYQTGTAMNTEFMLLAIYNNPRLNLKEVCSAIGMSIKTACNKCSSNTFPVLMAGDPLMADIRDVAKIWTS
jgi:hypothetical protein